MTTTTDGITKYKGESVWAIEISPSGIYFPVSKEIGKDHILQGRCYDSYLVAKDICKQKNEKFKQKQTV